MKPKYPSLLLEAAAMGFLTMATHNETELTDLLPCADCGRFPHLTKAHPNGHSKDFFIFCPNGQCERGGFRELSLEEARAKWQSAHAKEGIE